MHHRSVIPSAVASIALVCVLLVPAIAAAGVKIDLAFERPAPASQLRGDVVVTFEDRREPKKGGEEPELIGQARNGYGVPFGLFTTGAPIHVLVPALVADALRAEGVKAKPGRPNTGQARLHVRLDELWGDGHNNYDMWLHGELTWFAPGAAAPSWTAPLEAQGGSTIGWKMKQDLLDGYVRLLDDALTKLHGHFTSSAFRSALDGAGTSTTSASTSTPVSSGSPSVRPVTKDRTAAELTELYYTYQGTTPSPQQLLAGAGAVEALLGQGHTADAIRSAIVQVHREIPGAATASLESILPSYLASTASAGQTYTPRGGYELEVRDRGSDKARRMKKAGHKLFTGGALMYFIPMGIGVIASAALTADSRDPRVVTAPLVVLTPIVGPALMAVQLNLAWGELPPTIVLGAVFTTIETIGFIMLWDGVRRMVESGQYASRAHPERPRRHAVRDLFVAPTFRPGGGGLAIAGRF